MKISKTSLFIGFLVLMLFLAVSSSARVGPTYALVNCKIIPVSGPVVEKGIIIIRNGLIESLGPVEKISIPEDAEVIKADGLFAYPGLIDIHTNLFLEPAREEVQRPAMMEAAAAAPQAPDWAKQVGSMAFDLLKPKKSDIEDFQKIGITTVLVVPEKGIYAGQSVLLNINGEKKETMVINNPVALHINFTAERRIYPSSLMGTMALLRQSFLDTEYYSSYKAQFSKSWRGLKRPEYNPLLESLSPFVIQKKPVIFNCQNQEDIKRALGLIAEFKLNGFLSGANEAWRVAALLKKTKVPLLVSLDFRPPLTSVYISQSEELKEKAEKEVYPANAANLYKEGIKFALTSHGLKSAKILPNIQKAIKAGLPAEEALKAMTIIPAEHLGVSGILGSLEPGKIANIILTSGEIFGEKTKVERVFVDGLLFEVKQPPKEAKPSALSVAGKWKASVSGPMGEMEMTLELKQEGNTITGNVSTEMGKWEISDGLLSGNELTFVIVATMMGEKMEIAFSGTAQKDSMEGTLSFMGGSAKLKATRIPEMNL